MEMNKINIVLTILAICLLEALLFFVFLGNHYNSSVEDSNALLILSKEDQNISSKEQELKHSYNITE